MVRRFGGTPGQLLISVESSTKKDIKSYYYRKTEIIMDQIEGTNLIKDEDLERLGKLNEVDKCNTILVGKIIFKGLMKLKLMGQRTSLRALEMVINSFEQGFRNITNKLANSICE